MRDTGPPGRRPDIGTVPDALPPDDLGSTEADAPDLAPIGLEDCNNGVDDNDDRLVDCADPLCSDGPLCTGTECPGALDLKCELSHSDRTPEDDLFVLPLSSLSCRVQTSDMGDWVPVRWEVVEAPAGSSASFVPEGEREASFFVDLAGRFVLRATAEESGCSYSDTVTLVSRPDEDIHIQVVWNTPGDPDQTDTGFGAGTDFDLHFLHENGCWEDSTYDCHFRARQPNWGNPARSDDDPSLDIDDTDGAGPENINLDNPEHDRQYRLGVHSYNDHGYGPSLVTMRVFVFGELVYEYADKELGDDEWWVVGAIDWPSGEVVAIDEIYQDVPSCGN